MKFKLNTLVAAALLAAAGSASAAIDNGAGGNGELFFNIWDANGSYSRDLNVSIDAFQTTLAAAGNIDLRWAADSTLTSFLAGVADATALKWNIMATDTSGARRLLTTFTAPTVSPTKTNDIIRTAATNTQTFVNSANTALAGSDSVAVNAASAAFAGKATFKDNVGGYLNFSNAGTLANNSYAGGLSFMRIDALASGTAKSVYNQYFDSTVAANAYLGADRSLHITAAVPEADTYALMLSGLALVGFVARRRLSV